MEIQNQQFQRRSLLLSEAQIKHCHTLTLPSLPLASLLRGQISFWFGQGREIRRGYGKEVREKMECYSDTVTLCYQTCQNHLLLLTIWHNEESAFRAWYQHCRKWPFLVGGCIPRTSIYGNVDIMPQRNLPDMTSALHKGFDLLAYLYKVMVQKGSNHLIAIALDLIRTQLQIRFVSSIPFALSEAQQARTRKVLRIGLRDFWSIFPLILIKTNQLTPFLKKSYHSKVFMFFQVIKFTFLYEILMNL